MKDISVLQKTDVVILCGGPGTRLGSMTKDIPKPMVMIGTRPFLEILIDYVISSGFRRFVLCVGHKKEAIEGFFSARKAGVTVVYSEEDEGALLGTAGAIKNAEKAVKSDTFLVLNGDSFAPIDLGSFLEFHEQKKGSVSIALTRAAQRIDAGSVRLNEKDEVTGFSEKNSIGPGTYMSAGVYFFNTTVFRHIPGAARFTLEYDLFPALIGKGIYGYITDADVVDIGTPERLARAKMFFTEGP